MFDPSIGRFITEDPSGFDAGDPDLYRYVKNDPTNATDPSGLAAQDISLDFKEVVPVTGSAKPAGLGDWGTFAWMIQWKLTGKVNNRNPGGMILQFIKADTSVRGVDEKGNMRTINLNDLSNIVGVVRHNANYVEMWPVKTVANDGSVTNDLWDVAKTAGFFDPHGTKLAGMSGKAHDVFGLATPTTDKQTKTKLTTWGRMAIEGFAVYVDLLPKDTNTARSKFDLVFRPTRSGAGGLLTSGFGHPYCAAESRKIFEYWDTRFLKGAGLLKNPDLFSGGLYRKIVVEWDRRKGQNTKVVQLQKIPIPHDQVSAFLAHYSSGRAAATLNSLMNAHNTFIAGLTSAAGGGIADALGGLAGGNPPKK